MKKDSLKNQILTMLSGGKKCFVKFFVGDKLYKQIPCAGIKPGSFLHNGTMYLFCTLNGTDIIVREDQATCDAMIDFLFNPKR